MIKNELPHFRANDFAPAAAAENAVMASAFGFQMLLVLCRNVGAEFVRCTGLASTRDIVQLAFNGQQCGRFDLGRVSR